MDMRDVAHEDDPTVDRLDRKRVDGLDHVRRIVHGQRIVFVSDFHVARGQNDILMLQRRTHIRGRQTPRLQSL